MIDSPRSIITASCLYKTIKTLDTTLHLLTDINLTINALESVAIVGVSGSGKSTLLGLLAGLDNPSSGEIILLDQALHLLNEDQRALLRLSSISFIFQSFLLFRHLTALENVALALELKNEKGTAREKAIYYLKKVKLENRLHHYPHQLSGGEQQRVAIARAFITEPVLLFADEITGSLDKKTGELIADLLFDLNAEKKTTLVLVTHDEVLAKRCSRILHLDEGKLI